MTEQKDPDYQEFETKSGLSTKFMHAWQRMDAANYVELKVADVDELEGEEAWQKLSGSRGREFEIDLDGNPETGAALEFWSEGGYKHTEYIETTDGTLDSITENRLFTIVIAEPQNSLNAEGRPLAATIIHILDNGLISAAEQVAKGNPKDTGYDYEPRPATEADVHRAQVLLEKVEFGEIRPPNMNRQDVIRDWGPLGPDPWDDASTKAA